MKILPLGNKRTIDIDMDGTVADRSDIYFTEAEFELYEF